MPRRPDHLGKARALAALGEANDAAAAVAQAEQALSRVDHESEPVWAKFTDAPYLFCYAALCFRDLGQPGQVERFAQESAAAARRQRRAVQSEAALSIADLQRHNVEAAAARALHVVDLAGSVNSWRAVATVRDLQRRTKPYATVHEVQRFNARASDLLGLAT